MKFSESNFRAILLALAVTTLPLTASADRDDRMMHDDDNMPMMGMGGGMMGGGMMGGGMMGMSPIYMLDLSDTQRTKIRAIQRQLRRSHFDAMEKMADHHEALWKLYRAERRDPKQIGTVYGKIFLIKQKMIESSIEQSNRMEAVLTKEQRKQLRAWSKNMGMGYRGRGYRDRDHMRRGMMN